MQALEAGPSTGPLVLLLHGFPELSESWREVLPVLGAAGFHAVAPDLRGYGGTDRPASGYDMDTLARDIQQLAHHLQPGRPAHLVGHDWGGAIAYHVAAHHPDSVDRLAVVNCPPPSVMARRIWWPPQLVRSWYMFFFQLPLLPERLLSSNGGARVPQLIRRAMVDTSRATDERLAPSPKPLRVCRVRIPIPDAPSRLHRKIRRAPLVFSCFLFHPASRTIGTSSGISAWIEL